MNQTQKLLFVVLSVLTIVVRLEAVSVNPLLCPTNKIAPHRRTASWEQSRPRTLGLIYSLITPNRPRPQPNDDLDDLQELPQEDDPDDCGEIEDYDETDLSSITPGAQNQVYNNRFREHRYLFGDNYIPSYNPVANRPVRPPHRPQRPPYPPIKPTYNSGGIFGSNTYRPPGQHYPSNHIKPVQENTYDNPKDTYRPGLVGGLLGHVVGFPLKRPPDSDEETISQSRPSSPIRFPDSNSYRKRHARAKPPNVATGIIGSFVDLLFN